MKNFYQVGDNVDVKESLLGHPAHADGLVDSGDPVCINALVGVANFDAIADTDIIVVSTRGVFKLSVIAHDKAGADSAIGVGEKLFINPVDGVISKADDKTPFGIALEAVAAGETATIPVKIWANV